MHPIRYIKSRAIAAYLRHRIIGRRNWREIVGFLDGYKEKITGVLGGLLLMLSSFGLTDWIAPLRPIHEAIKGGDWQAALAAFVGAILVWMRTFRRMRDDKAEGLS